MARPRDALHTERCYLVARGLRALSHGIPIEVNGIARGKLRQVANDYTPQRELKEGGSSMRFVFEDDTDIPCEDIKSIERAS